jgi:hypothetical protein
VFAASWEPLYPAMVGMWRRSWAEFIPFLDFPIEIRSISDTTNGIESLNARFWAATRGPRPLPRRTVSAQDPLPRRPGTILHRQIAGRKHILNVLSLTYGDRLGLN